jgi:RNA polymerase sigma-70 factor (ECF subfamily)
MEDFEVIVSIKSGDKKAFEQLFYEYYQMLVRYAFTYMKDHDIAEEVVQDIMVKFWEKRAELPNDVKVKPYLFRMTGNHCLNVLKHEKVKLQHQTETVANGISMSDGFEVIASNELNTEIKKAIADLPEQCGKVFLLSRDEGLSYKEIAESLDISIKTVENHISKALKLLREALKPYLTILLIDIQLLIEIFYSK